MILSSTSGISWAGCLAGVFWIEYRLGWVGGCRLVLLAGRVRLCLGLYETSLLSAVRLWRLSPGSRWSRCSEGSEGMRWCGRIHTLGQILCRLGPRSGGRCLTVPHLGFPAHWISVWSARRPFCCCCCFEGSSWRMGTLSSSLLSDSAPSR